jgi:hypothetical protein
LRTFDEEALLLSDGLITSEGGPANALVTLLQRSGLELTQEHLGRHSVKGRLILRAREIREAKYVALANRETGINSKASRSSSLARLLSGGSLELIR